ncbi:MAG: Rieske 2Fe-2S domain-containing protein [Candidatus Bathyarchaeia archaeon]
MTEEGNQPAEALIEKYELKIPKEIVTSVFIGQPKLPVLLSRASFRPDADVRTEQRTRFQRERRNFLHSMLGFAAVSVSALVLLKIATLPSSQGQTPTYVSQPGTQNGRLLANAANIPVNQSLALNDPTFGPIILIHLDNGQVVAYSSVCTHAGCLVQFDPAGRDIACPCHGAVYDPYNNAQVLAGPAPYPLQKIPIQYDASTGNIYLSG